MSNLLKNFRISYSTLNAARYSTKIELNKVKTNHFNYSLNVIKQNDYNTYLNTLLAPEPILRAAFAIKAFNIELLLLNRSNNDTKSQISLMKLQFWKVSQKFTHFIIFYYLLKKIFLKGSN